MDGLNNCVSDSLRDGNETAKQFSKLGVFGGTFDPPHIGHLILAEEALYQLGLDLVLWVLTPNPPHKGNRIISPLEVRLPLLQAAIQDQPRFLLSRIDIDRPPPHYAVDTLRLIQEQYPAASLSYLIGGDSLRDLPQWHAPANLLRLCSSLGVMQRPGGQVDLSALEINLPGITAHIRWIEAPLLEISATQIRKKIKSGQAYQFYLHPAVVQLIQERNYYQD
jgi:nicotinate-nucleotide adenylyltransferase